MQLPFKQCVLSDYPNGSVTQWYGENTELYSRWGLKYHNGVDLVAPHGTPLLAIEDSLVVDVKLEPDGYGKHIRLRSTKPDNDGRYRVWVYGHCSSIREVLGATVKAGDHIADMGNTGFVVSGANPWWEHNPYAGTHLHLGLRLVLPDENGWAYPGDTMKIRVHNYKNGVKGAIDPIKYLGSSELPSDRQKMLTIISILNTVISLQKQLLSKIQNG